MTAPGGMAERGTDADGTHWEQVPLAEFASTQKVKGPCWVCSLKERSEVDAGLRNGVSQKVVETWLREQCAYGDEATNGRINGHVRRRHHLQENS